ncbi:putative transmembrane protein [Toxoplasma gondii TgCatPRC2]|uniref:Transmembrane protein n=5 Tax=Toxoplasma gondii TaxID=5811 RepID=S7VYM7_TOXGG|nr:hypothetical protein TGME49_319500 [Toxoplasma gondii ME49]EPR58128.1 hypothetical protein TGGT1_319500 [Toxoplasma gondii GT1]KAF4644947.1 hypothetical protein TGRH88_007620 [Toxoplasma gondii]KYF39126.1 hypothetical protein TGARI_319500 [Toxoplasma gondii ARI]KYK66874.1 putative transmembrane protein [Toxoplasma gondii TgCatPRC2]EPT31500.1 hypothetical protein TGME49_319500 [Toxoplasma gondii ME49]|eukprot:XP_002369827.1 hypothetical protein TGME49_319500 [Toxoplasma gondii ME49]
MANVEAAPASLDISTTWKKVAREKLATVLNAATEETRESFFRRLSKGFSRSFFTAASVSLAVAAKPFQSPSARLLLFFSSLRTRSSLPVLSCLARMSGPAVSSASVPQQAVSWNFLAYLLTFGVLVVQQMGLLYYLANYSLALLALGAFDVFVLLSFLSNSSADLAALKGSTCWVLYDWALTVKIVVFFFVVFGSDHLVEGFLFDGPHGTVVEVSLLVVLACAVYALLGFRAMEQLVGGVSQISTEAMLLTDCITHVVLDFIDLTAAFFTYSACPLAISQQTSWLRLVVGIVISLAFFLHAYSFPSVGARSPLLQRQEERFQKDTGDIFMSRKHAALLGVCVVDLPLAAVRLFTWAYYPTYEGFSPFLLKNICFIPLQCSRIRHASLAAHLKAKRQHKLQLHSILASREATNPSATTSAVKVQQQQLQKSVAAMEVRDGAAGAGPAAAGRPLGDREFAKVDRSDAIVGIQQTGAAGGQAGRELGAETGGNAGKKGRARKRDDVSRQSCCSGLLHALCCCLPCGGAKGPSFLDEIDLDDDSAMTEEERMLARLAELCRTASGKTRRLPVKGFAFKRVIQKLYFSYKVGGRLGVAALLDNALKVTFWKELRIAIPFIATWICQIAIVACLFFFYNDSPVFPIQMFSLKAVAEHPWPWSEIPVELQVCFIIICGHFLMLLFCWFLSAPLLDVLFVSFFGSLKLLSFFLMVLTFRDFGVFNSIFNLHLYVMDFGRYAIFIFTLVPMIGVLYTLYPVLCVMLGRQYITYIIPPPRIGKYRRGQTVLDAGRPGGEADFAQLETHPRGDEAGVVATVCLMVFLNCSHMLAPISMNQLLVGPNMIKAVRLNDGLLRVHWRQLLLTLLLRLWCFILYLTFPNSITYSKDPGAIERVLEHYICPGGAWYERFSFASIVFLAHIVLTFFYMIFSQICRLLALRRFENKAMFKDLALLWMQRQEEKLNELALVAATGRSSISSTSPSTRHAGTREVRMIAEKYFAHCFHTCPGDFLPGFF